ncbi:MAG: hypothetical protein EPN47_08990 [Acidobacteria bacterium]|nr:MAG: hypothetical protein EPN47_08990 [Acidobacteriota bacterium]
MNKKGQSWYVSIPLTMLFAVPLPLLARSRQEPSLSTTSIHQMVENVAWNQLQASEHPAHYYRFVERDILPDGSTTVDEIATPHGSVDRLIEVDHHTPDRQQLAKNQQLLSQLHGNTQLQQSRFKDQQNDRQRRDNVIKDIPQAFIYTFDGRDQQGRIKLKFQPAPDFRPSSRQSLILQGMAGEMWIDPATQRLVKINGSLINDVKIGWGFLARLNTGGTFLMEQSQGPDGTWHQKLLSVHFDGTVLLLKHIHIRVKQIQCCFERVPDNLTIRGAVQLLDTRTTLPKEWQARLEAIEKSAPLN